MRKRIREENKLKEGRGIEEMEEKEESLTKRRKRRRSKMENKIKESKM